jgi:hypothetical protein
MASFQQDILVLCKTYPSPSGKHVETSCVAGMDPAGKLIRLFPVPFRLIDGAQQFKKWQWINARIERVPGDRRQESHKLFVDTVNFAGDLLSTARNWQARRDFAALEADRVTGRHHARHRPTRSYRCARNRSDLEA